MKRFAKPITFVVTFLVMTATLQFDAQGMKRKREFDSNPFTLLPNEIMTKIFEYLNDPDLLKASAVDYQFRAIACDMYKKRKAKQNIKDRSKEFVASYLNRLFCVLTSQKEPTSSFEELEEIFSKIKTKNPKFEPLCFQTLYELKKKLITEKDAFNQFSEYTPRKSFPQHAVTTLVEGGYSGYSFEQAVILLKLKNKPSLTNLILQHHNRNLDTFALVAVKGFNHREGKLCQFKEAIENIKKMNSLDRFIKEERAQALFLQTFFETFQINPVEAFLLGKGRFVELVMPHFHFYELIQATIEFGIRIGALKKTKEILEKMMKIWEEIINNLQECSSLETENFKNLLENAEKQFEAILF